MTVMLELTPDQEEQLRAKAARQGQEAEKLLQDMVRQMLSTEETASAPLPKRVAGLNRGQVLWISEDFDAPLPDFVEGGLVNSLFG